MKFSGDGTHLANQILGANQLCIDVSTALGGAAVSNGTAVCQIECNQAYTNDGLRPNNAGYDACVNLVYKSPKGLI